MDTEIAEDSKVFVKGTVAYVTEGGMASVRLASGVLIALPLAELVPDTRQEE